MKQIEALQQSIVSQSPVTADVPISELISQGCSFVLILWSLTITVIRACGKCIVPSWWNPIAHRGVQTVAWRHAGENPRADAGNELNPNPNTGSIASWYQHVRGDARGKQQTGKIARGQKAKGRSGWRSKPETKSRLGLLFSFADGNDEGGGILNQNKKLSGYNLSGVCYFTIKIGDRNTSFSK